MKQELKKKLESIKSKEIISHTHTLIHSKRNHSFRKTLSISIVTSILLSNQLVLAKDITLPSGGKFTNGSSGSINISNGTNCKNCVINIKGDNKNNVIAWGGGFNIGNGYTVNFGGSGKGYLNLDYSKNPSILAGKLNGGDNNIFLVNPSGVIIEKGGVINANRFVASTSAIDGTTLNAFKEANEDNTLASFSPVFKPNKQGDIINRGNINANKVLMIGNNVRIDGGSINGMHNKGSDLKNPSGTINKELHLVGNNVFINVENIKSNSVIASAYKSGALQQSTTNYVTNKDAITNFNFSTANYNKVEGNSNNAIGKSEFKKYATMGSAEDWINFANGWNNNTNGMQNFFDEYHLTNNIDMNWTLVDPIGHTNAFNKNFNGNGYTLSNVMINAIYSNAGLFGYIKNSKISDLNIKRLEFDYSKGYLINVGSFAGRIDGSDISNIKIEDVGDIKAGSSSMIHKSQVGVGGFAGGIGHSNINNIVLRNVKSVEINGKGFGDVGGFAGVFESHGWTGTIENILVDGIGHITNNLVSNTPVGYTYANAAGFYANGATSLNTHFKNIILKNIGSIYSKEGMASGFSAYGTPEGEPKNIANVYIYFAPNAKITSGVGKAFKFSWLNSNSPINTLQNINIYHHENDFKNIASSNEDKAINFKTYKGDMETQFDNLVLNQFKNDGLFIDTNGKLNFIANNKDSYGLNKVTLSSDDFSKEIVQSILDEVLGGKLQVDINKLFIYDKSSGSITLNTDYLKTLGGEDYQQAISFLKAFYGEDSLGEYLADLGVTEWKDLLDTNNKIVISKNKFLDFLNNNLQTKIKLFEEWKSNYELYTSGLATEEQMKNLESWFKNNEATLKAYQAFLDDPMLTDIGEHNFKLGDGSLSFVNGKGYKDLSIPPQKDGGDNQRITSPLKDINASMLDKQQVVLIKPAEEEKETLDEEKGVLNQRTCVVSENFKTNNPCMAQRI